MKIFPISLSFNNQLQTENLDIVQALHFVSKVENTIKIINQMLLENLIKD